MAEQMVTEDELLNGDPSLREDSTDLTTKRNSSYSFDSDMSYDEPLQDTTEALSDEGEVTERTYSNVYGQSDNWDRGVGDTIYVDHEHYNQNLIPEATVDDLRALYEANTDMQEMFGSFETYLAYMNERQDLIDAGVAGVDFIGAIGAQAEVSAADQAASAELQQLALAEAQGTLTAEQAARKAELEAAGVVPSLAMPGQMTGGGENYLTSQEAYDAMMASEEMAALNEEYGLPTGPYQNERGDTVMWTGSGQVVHTALNKSAADWLGPVLFSIAAGVIAGPIGGNLTTALTNAGLPSALASAASSTIMNMATQLATTGEIDFSQALLSAAGAYFQENGLGDLLGDSAVSDALTDVTNTVTGALDEFEELISTGSSIADAAIQAGGMSMLVSLVTDGEVDVEQALIAAAMAGGTTALNDLAASGAVTEGDVAEFEQWMQQDDEMQQALIDADVKDPFLNPNYTYVDGDNSLMTDADGNVYNNDGEQIGTMNELDLDGDGLLTGSDLQEVGDTAEFNQQYAPPETTTSPTIFTTEWADERYAGMSEAQIREQMARDGFNDEQIETYIGTLPEIDTTTINHAGGWTEDTSQPYTLHYRDGQHYVVSNGYLKAITEEQYTDLYADLQDGTASLDSLEQYGVGNPGLSGGGEVVTGVDPITEEGSFDPQSDWISLDPSEEQVGGQIEFTEEPVEPEPVEPEPVELEDVQETEPDPTDSTEQPETGVETAPSTPAAGVSAELEQLEEQYQQAVSQGDYITANMILAQIQQMQQEQVVEDDVTNIFEDTASAIEDADGTFQQEVSPEKPEVLVGGGTETTEQPVEDSRTQWQKNKDFIISQVEAGTATDGQQAWYDQWTEAGSPDTQQGMVQGDAEDGTTGTTEPGEGGTGQEREDFGGGAQLPGSTVGGTPDRPTSPVGSTTPGPTLGFGPGQSTGLPGSGDGDGGGGGGGGGGMMTSGGAPAPFKPFQANVSYTTPTIQSLVQSPQVDYVGALNKIINRGMLT